MSSSAVLVLTTVDSRSKAEHISELMVSDGLCACAQISERITSVYIWKGKIQNEQEYLISFKTVSSKTESLMTAIKTNHPYETPEWVTWEAGASEGYYDWVANPD